MTIAPLGNWSSEGTWATFATGRFHTWVNGVELQKCDDDLDRYAELIEISQPDLVIEAGTRQGGSALWFRDLGLQVITIDRDKDAGRAARMARPHDWGIHYIAGDSADLSPDVITAMNAICAGKRVMVSLDSDHHADHVLREIKAWWSWVSPGCYLVVEDGCFEQWDEDRARVGGVQIPERGGPLRAVNQWMASIDPSHQQFWRDEALEGSTPISHSPGGWWRRHE